MNLTRRQLLGATLAAIVSPKPGYASEPRAQVPTPHFPPEATAEEVTRGLDLTSRTILVTGATSGIGLEMTRVLALRGAHVIGSSRVLDEGRTLHAALRGRIDTVALDLADFDSVRACAARVRNIAPMLDALVCNAGIVLGDWQQVRGIEKQFVVNHLGHFLLVNELLDLVTAAPAGRVVVVGSGDHRNAPPGGIQFDDLSGESWQGRGYAHSKLANGLFSLELARRLRDTRATSNCVTPGHTRTNILRHTGNRYGEHARSVAQGAATPCYATVHPDMDGVSAAYLRDFAPAEQGEAQKDAAMARRLWEVSQALTTA
jgi:NAD(P)-dependent dehydrogenase (short-subunit alcohol dehydrogenase family)